MTADIAGRLHENTRGNNEGSVYQRKSDGRWVGAITTGYGPNGSAVRKTITGSSKADVVRKLRAFLRIAEEESKVTNSSLTFLHLYERWVDSVLAYDVATSTRENYTGLCKKHVLPVFGHRKVKDITVSELDQFLAKKLSGGLSASTVHRLRALISQCIDQGIRWGEVERNVARLTRSPKLTRPEGRSLTLEQAKILMTQLESEHYGVVFMLMLATGIRRGEALGLMWSDVDFEGGIIRVRRSLKREGGAIVTADTKTLKSRRAVRVPSPMMEKLTDLKVLQMEKNLRLGDARTKSDFVFTTSVGTPIEPRNVHKEFVRACKRAGLGHWHPHELRHSAATLMLANGIKLQVVSQILGHSSTRMTADVYGHILDPDKDGAASAMASLLWD